MAAKCNQKMSKIAPDSLIVHWLSDAESITDRGVAPGVPVLTDLEGIAVVRKERSFFGKEPLFERCSQKLSRREPVWRRCRLSPWPPAFELTLDGTLEDHHGSQARHTLGPASHLPYRRELKTRTPPAGSLRSSPCIPRCPPSAEVLQIYDYRSNERLLAS